MMFAGLTSAFIVKSNLVGWRDIKMPGVFWVSTAVILLSSLTIQMAVRAFRQRDMRNYRVLMGTTVLLGTAFIVLQWFGFKQLWDEQQITFKGVSGAGQFLYVIFGLHAVHVIGGVITLIVLFAKAFLGKIKMYSPVPVEVAATYWHFVDILWIYLLVFFIVVG
ncbi:MAG: heme-copper oxidase subunit III [Chitinophagaceae bacterium]|nr:MAG: heme-copper oxidase subunit III [Chitinophagaceae bacterium]